jgi:casein kinase II subunit alpha
MSSGRADRQGIVYSVSKVYADVNERLGASWYDHKTLTPEYNPPEPYSLLKKVGRGKYSTVFKALQNRNHEVAIKILVPLDPRRYLREIKILKNLEGGRNIVRLLDLVLDPATKICSFIFEWVEFNDWRALYNSFDIEDIRLYLYKLLQALDYSHSRGIMHRDIKPQNIAIDKTKRRLRLLDWGLADFYHPRQKYNSHVATRMFKPPELLINYPYYDYSMDIWSTGITFSIMMLRKFVLECGDDDAQQLLKVADLVGGRGILDYARSLGVVLDDRTTDYLRRTPGAGWDHHLQKAPRDKCPPDALDLLKRMTVIDHRDRITAQEAMMHPFFDSLARPR